MLLLEDSGALLGLTCALLGVALALITGEPVFDGIGTLAIGILLLAIAFVLAREMRSLLIGESASPELEARIDAEFERAPEVRRVIHTLTEHIGPDEILIAAKLEFDPALTVAQLVDAINAAEVRVRAIEGIGTARIYVEPDVGPPETVEEAAAPPPQPKGVRPLYLRDCEQEGDQHAERAAGEEPVPHPRRVLLEVGVVRRRRVVVDVDLVRDRGELLLGERLLAARGGRRSSCRTCARRRRP